MLQKLVIPIILGSIVLLAMLFSFMSVQKANTVHGSIQNTIIRTATLSDAIGASELADGAIDAGAIATDAVTAAKIATDAVTAAKIATDAVTAAKIATDAIGASELATDAVNEIRDANSVDQERIFSFTVDSTHGTTAITDAVLIPDNNVVLVGRVEAVMLRDTDGLLGGSPTLVIECVNSDTSVTALDTLNNLNDKISATLTGTCESVRMDLGAGGDASDGVGAIISIYIDNWPAV